MHVYNLRIHPPRTCLLSALGQNPAVLMTMPEESCGTPLFSIHLNDEIYLELLD